MGDATDFTPLPVDQEFLQRRLNHVYGTSSRIAKTESEVIGEGKGFMSYMTKTTVYYDPEDPALPRVIVVKKPTLDRIKVFEFMADFKIDNLRDLHNREVQMYDYLTKYGCPPIPIPKCIYKEELTTEGTGMLILEFVEGKSVHFSSDTTACQLLTIAASIGKLQAYGLNHPEFKDLFPPLLVNPFDRALAMLETAAADARQRYPGVFTLTEQQCKELGEEAEESGKLFTGGLADQYMPVLCLGDMQPNNLLWIERNGERTADVAAFLDFQVAVTGCAGYDLSVACSMGHSPESLHRHRTDIIGHYYSALVESVEKGVEVPSMDEVNRSFDRYYRYYAAIGIGFVQQMDDIKDTIGIGSQRVVEIARRICVGLNS